MDVSPGIKAPILGTVKPVTDCCCLYMNKVEQDFSTLVLPAFETRPFFVVQGHPAYYTIINGISGLCLLDASSPPGCDNNNSLQTWPNGHLDENVGQNCSSRKTTEIDVWCFYSLR